MKGIVERADREAMRLHQGWADGATLFGGVTSLDLALCCAAAFALAQALGGALAVAWFMSNPTLHGAGFALSFLVFLFPVLFVISAGLPRLRNLARAARLWRDQTDSLVAAHGSRARPPISAWAANPGTRVFFLAVAAVMAAWAAARIAALSTEGVGPLPALTFALVGGGWTLWAASLYFEACDPKFPPPSARAAARGSGMLPPAIARADAGAARSGGGRPETGRPWVRGT